MIATRASGGGALLTIGKITLRRFPRPPRHFSSPGAPATGHCGTDPPAADSTRRDRRSAARRRTHAAAPAPGQPRRAHSRLICAQCPPQPRTGRSAPIRRSAFFRQLRRLASLVTLGNRLSASGRTLDPPFCAAEKFAACPISPFRSGRYVVQSAASSWAWSWAADRSLGWSSRLPVGC